MAPLRWSLTERMEVTWPRATFSWHWRHSITEPPSLVTLSMKLSEKEFMTPSSFQLTVSTQNSIEKTALGIWIMQMYSLFSFRSSSSLRLWSQWRLYWICLVSIRWSDYWQRTIGWGSLQNITSCILTSK